MDSVVRRASNWTGLSTSWLDVGLELKAGILPSMYRSRWGRDKSQLNHSPMTREEIICWTILQLTVWWRIWKRMKLLKSLICGFPNLGLNPFRHFSKLAAGLILVSRAFVWAAWTPVSTVRFLGVRTVWETIESERNQSVLVEWEFWLTSCHSEWVEYSWVLIGFEEVNVTEEERRRIAFHLGTVEWPWGLIRNLIKLSIFIFLLEQSHLRLTMTSGEFYKSFILFVKALCIGLLCRDERRWDRLLFSPDSQI